MLVDQFWKIVFAILVGVGCWFWWKDASARKAHTQHIQGLAELIDVSPEGKPKSDAEAAQRIFQAMAMLEAISYAQGEDFDLPLIVDEAITANDPDEDVADLVKIVVVSNFEIVHKLGLVGDEDAVFRMQEGERPKIPKGNWKGQYAEVGYYIPPSVDDSVASHFCNRIILPETVKGARAVGEITRTIDDWAKRLKRIKGLDLANCDRIEEEYIARRKSGRRR